MSAGTSTVVDFPLTLSVNGMANSPQADLKVGLYDCDGQR
jgi:hypothetical protein